MEEVMDCVAAMENHNPLVQPSPNPLKCPPTSAPLNQLSPERMNQQRIPQSPSLHTYLGENERPRTRDSMMSDVQSKVAFLNTLSTQSSPTRQGRGDKVLPLAPAPTGITTNANAWPTPSTNNNNSNHAFQRAVMGYEEAQASMATLSAELERSKEELAARRKREKMIAQRIEMLLEELQTEKDKRGRDQESYSKEVKRCRKEAYRAELALVEAREELKDVRNELKKSHLETHHEKSEKEKSRQEAFERAYTLAGVLEEMEQLKDRLKATEKERDTSIEEAKATMADKTALEDAHSCEVANAAKQPVRFSNWLGDYEGRCVSNPSTVSDDSKAHQPLPSFTSLLPSFDSIKSHLDLYDKQLEGEELTPDEEIEFLKQELKWVKRQHTEDEDLIHFMHMQCQFKACPCRIAEASGERFVHDYAYDAGLQQDRASKKRKISAKASETTENYEDLPVATLEQDQGSHMEANPSAIIQPLAEETLVLPPEPSSGLLTQALEEPCQLEEAVGVPLPEPQPMELDPSDDTPEPTAQLEEITQVLVEPSTTTKPFSFSTSTTSNAGSRAGAPSLRHTESASAALEQDLFDLSPPKQALPRRPSTAMGILTVESPIRLVPDSPRSVRTAHDVYTHSSTPPFYHDNMFTESTTTTKIALKDSPPRSGLHKRAQSRPNIRSHSPLASAMTSQVGDTTIHAEDLSASPAESTVFPMTPLYKPAGSIHNLAQHAGTHEQNPPQTIATTTTTTRVPLRGFGDADDVFSPAHDNERHAHTEVIRITTSETSVNMMPTNTFSESTSNQGNPLSTSSSILGNVPGTPISREAALAQIRARRDRARSVNLKRSTGSLVSGGTMAPSGGKSPTKPRAAGLFGRDRDGVARREISQASAPGRFG